MNRPLLRAGLLACAILLGLGPSPGRAQSFPRLLEDIKVYSAQNLEVVQFNFSKPYEGTPGEDHRRGELALNFLGIGSNPPDRSFQVRESGVLQGVRVAQGRFSTTVTLSLRDPQSSLKDRLDFSRDGNALRMAIRPSNAATRPAPSTGTSDKELLQQMERVIANHEATVTEERVAPGGTPQTALGGFNGMDWIPTLLTMVVALAFICAALYGVAVLYNRFVGSRLARLSGDHSIRVVAQHHIGPKQRIVVVEINGELYACGVTATQISFLTRLSGGLPQGDTTGDPPAAPPAPQPGKPGDEPGAGGGALSGQAQAAQHFANVLKQKVRSLKQIK
ncbi:MAG: flagellar biosynthetic protein FliO [Candidatus Lambdaproteobacteria bacterium]|nr:flagellar biosynthetic protein FliO [Candidatus Lambdaproteobacteria bacterium]